MKTDSNPELTSLQNFATNLNKKFDLNVKIKLWFDQDKRKKPKFILVLDNYNHKIISPVLCYDKMNHFLLGINKCKNLNL